MKYLFSLIIAGIFIYNSLQAQNVGIGNSSPAEKLDVTGNINVTGTIKANGSDGTANQILMKNNSGNLVWGNIGSYTKSDMFIDTSASNNWVVPAGVTHMLVEMWGGGGAGLEEGGGSGAYVTLIFDNLTAGNTFNVSVGKGGKDVPIIAGSFTYGQNGSASSLSTPSNGAFYANGGFGAMKNTSLSYWVPGDGGTYGYTFGATSFPVYYYQQGQSGGGRNFTYFAIVAPQYNVSKSYGAGADAPNTTNTGGSGARRLENVNGGVTTLINYVSAKPGKFPGGGGGGGEALPYDNRAGANGTVIIHY